MLRRQGSYLVVRKISPLVYELDLTDDSRIYPVISIAYLSRYHVRDDPFKCTLAPPGPVEYSAETDMFGDDTRDRKHWELERVVDHATRRGKTYYLVRWKGYGPQYDKWLKLEALKHAARLVEDYHERLQRKEELRGAGDGVREKRRDRRRKQGS